LRGVSSLGSPGAGMARRAAKGSANLLVEIGTEELPPRALCALGESFRDELCAALTQEALLTAPVARWFATPRRLAVWIEGVRREQPDRPGERRGPALKAAFDASGRPSKAALGFAKSCGVNIDQLERVESDKGSWLVYRYCDPGRSASQIIPECIARAAQRLPVPKRMRWSDLDAEFVRPVHWLVILHGANVIKADLLSVSSGRHTYGHRFHAPSKLRIPHADEYELLLSREGAVVPDFRTRREQIERQVTRLAQRVSGRALLDDELLDVVTGLVEKPHALLGAFERDFLSVPKEVLITSMRDHQKYFAVADPHDKLLPAFITVSNIKSRKPAQVRSGNERVLRARLSDARFFWDSDRKTTLSSRLPQLEQVLFHRKLGSVADKTARLLTVVTVIADRLGADTTACRRTAELAKADLVTEMVGEFPELQGVMGRYYAEHDGESEAVARAIEAHYRPRFAGDALPHDEIAQVVALGDKADTLVGIFAAGEPPTGDKDPYGLRRAALGILRILVEGKIDLDLGQLFRDCGQVYRSAGIVVDDVVIEQVFDFCLERLNAYYNGNGFASEEIQAVAARRPGSPLDFDRRLRAVAEFRRMPEAISLAAANKRIANILRRAEDDIPSAFDTALLASGSEKILADRFSDLSGAVAADFDRNDYAAGLKRLAGLREPVDRYFDDVMVMVDDARLRQNRLALLKQIHDLFLRGADISLLQVAGSGAES